MIGYAAPAKKKTTSVQAACGSLEQVFSLDEWTGNRTLAANDAKKLSNVARALSDIHGEDGI